MHDKSMYCLASFVSSLAAFALLVTSPYLGLALVAALCAAAFGLAGVWFRSPTVIDCLTRRAICAAGMGVLALTVMATAVGQDELLNLLLG